MTTQNTQTGFITLRNFKIYLLKEGVNSIRDIEALKTHLELVMKQSKHVLFKQDNLKIS